MSRTPTPDEARRAAAAAGEVPARRLVLTPASAIEPEPVVWAWEDNGQGRMAAGSLGLFAGREGTGKSSFLIWMAAKVTRGELPGAFKGDPRATIYVAVEDSWKFTIVPRLMAAGADLDLVYRAEVQEVNDGTVSLSLPADNCLLEEAITSHGVALVALDPLLSAISDTLDTHVNRQVRQALDPLARMADRTGAVIAGVAHFNKSGGTDASSLITASGAFKDVARFIFAFATDDGDDSKVITQTKNSLGRADLPSLAYRIIDATVPTAKGDASVGRFVLDGETDRTVRDILTVQASGGADRDEKTRAEDYLKKALGDGPRPTREVEEEAREVHQISKRTLERARTGLKIPSAKHGAIWWMSLPEHEGDLTDGGFISAKYAKSASPGGDGGDGGVDPPADPPSLREDTHDEQERLYPQTLQIRDGRDDRFLPTRAEWAEPEAAEYAVVTRCFASERVPSGAEHYLSPAELDEVTTLSRELCQATRPALTAEIKRLRALLPGRRPTRVREHTAWYLALSEDDQAAACRLSELEDTRRDLGRMLRDGRAALNYDPLHDRLHSRHELVAGFVPGQDKPRRRTELLDKLTDARKAAGQAAEDAAVAAEQARRLTDEGWATELQHRESLEEYFGQGAVR